MEVLEAVDKRFSCRSYKSKNIREGDLRLLLESAVKAPNAGNLQVFRFVVVKSEEKRQGIAKAALEQMWIAQAPVVIVICCDTRDIKRFYKSKWKQYSIQDCAVAAENLMLAATSIGLASCFVGAFDEEKIRQILILPDNVVPYIIIPLGYSNELPSDKKRSSIDSFVYFNEYGNKEDVTKGTFPLSKHEEKLEKANIFNKIKKLFKKD